MSVRQQKKRAKELRKAVRRLVDKRAGGLREADVQAIEKCLTDLDGALDAGQPDRLQAAMESLEQRAQRSLGYERKSSVREMVESLLVAVAVALVLRAFVVEPFKIPTGSMIPTLLVGDHIFVSKFAYGFRVPLSNAWFATWATPERGDVIVFRYPEDQSKDYIKRVVAVAGDEVYTDGIDVFVNGTRLPREQLERFEYLEEGEGGPMLGSRDAQRFAESALGSSASYTVLYEDRPVRPGWPSGASPPGLRCSNGPVPRRRCRVADDYLFVMGDNRDNSQDSRWWGGVPTSFVKGKALFIWWSYGPRSGIRWTRLGRVVP
ncbi:MAG: signal peptidase I [Myxococcota bacterium]